MLHAVRWRGKTCHAGGLIAPGPRPTVLLGLRCDGACIFCAQAGLAPVTPSPSVVATALAALRATSDEVTFVGGEPLLATELAEHIAAARSLGFARVGVQTNGVRLAEPGAVARLADAGLTDVHLSIHGAQPAVHDYHTGRPGSLVAALGTLAAARARSLDCVVVTVVTRSNFRVIGELPQLLSSRGASAWCASFPIARGRVEPAFDRIMPRLALAMPFVLHALQAAKSLALPSFIEGAPLCLLGPYSPLSLLPRESKERGFGETCATCVSRTACPGVDVAYLARFDGDELDHARAQNVAPLAASALTRMFVGIGERAPATRAETRRVALPVLGKVQPGRGEVARTVPRKTGEALRDLFPALLATSAAHDWPVDVVLCGSGARARRLAEASRETPGLVFIAVASPHAPERPPFDVEGVVPHRSLAAAIAHRKPRAVIVAAATDAHAVLVREALAATLPVLVEKPVGATPDETAQLADDARARGVLVMPAWQLVFLPGLDALHSRGASELAFELSVRSESGDAPRARAAIAEPLHHALGVLVWLAAGRTLQLAHVTVSDETVPHRVTVQLASADLAATVRLDFDAAEERLVVRAGDTAVERTARGIAAVRDGERVPLAQEGSDAARLLAHFRDVVRGDAAPRVTLDDAARAEYLVAQIMGSLTYHATT